MRQRLSGQERRRQIAEAALEIIAAQGLRGFTTAAIAQAVGLAEGTIFRHFASKEEIVLEAINLAEEMLAGQFPPPAPPPDGDPIERLGRFVVARVNLIRAHLGLFRILFSDQLAQAASAEGAQRVEDLKKRSLQFVRKCLHEAAQHGLLADGADPDVLGFVIHGTALSLVFQSQQDNDSPAPAPERVWASLERLIRRRA